MLSMLPLEVPLVEGDGASAALEAEYVRCDMHRALRLKSNVCRLGLADAETVREACCRRQSTFQSYCRAALAEDPDGSQVCIPFLKCNSCSPHTAVGLDLT